MEVGKSFVVVLILFMTIIVRGQNCSKCHFVSGVDNAVLLSCEIELNFPSRFYKQQTNYEEGVFYSYSDKDGARITVFQGALMAFPEDAYTYYSKNKSKDRTIYTGYNNGYYWRKDSVCEDVRIYYNNVDEKKKSLFDKVLDELKIMVFK